MTAQEHDCCVNRHSRKSAARPSTLLTAAIALSLLALAGCDVEQTRKGDITAPAYEVKKTQEGNVTLPKYDVTTPDVNVGTKQETVIVPTVVMQEKTITVPTVDVKSADEVKKDQKK